MGLFSSLVSAAKTAVSKVISSEKKYISDIKTGNLPAVAKTAATKVLGFQVATAAAAATILGGPTAAKVAAKALPALGGATIKAIKSPVQTAKTAAGLGVSAVAISALSSSKKAQAAVIKTPSSLVNFGTNIGKAIDSPSLSNVANIAKENPVLSAAAVAGAALVVGKAAGTAATLANTKAIKEGNEIAQLPRPSVGMVSPTPSPSPQLGIEKAVTPIAPIAPIPKPIKKKPIKKKAKKKAPKKRYKSKKKATKKSKTRSKKGKKTKLKFGSKAYRKKYLSKKYINKNKSKKKKGRKRKR